MIIFPDHNLPRQSADWGDKVELEIKKLDKKRGGGGAGGDGAQGQQGPQGAQGPMGLQGEQGVQGVQGEVGPQGPQGLQGETGLQGIQGIPGQDGAQGPQGIQGPAGADGLDGAIGPMGPQGPQGIQGETGPQGIQGIQGATGPMGPQGPAGIDGTNGLDGATGPMGPAGPQGLKGDKGDTGAQGLTGLSAYQVAQLDGFLGTESEWLLSLEGADGATGPEGPMGPQGVSITLKGSVATVELLPLVGNTVNDAYIVDADGDLWVWATTGWYSAGQIVGPQGLTGPQGATGPTGPTGATGVVAATLPATYDSLTQTVGVNQDAFDHISNLDYAQFDTTYGNGSTAPGMLAWNGSDGTLEFQLKGGDVTLQIGQEQVIRVKNGSGSLISNGSAVYLSSSDGSNFNISKAIATGDTTSAQTIGITTQDFANGSHGYVTTFGLVRNIDTSALIEGGAVYLSPTVAGGLTAVKPSAPDHLVYIGACLKVSATNGVIFVKIQNGYEIDELHNVVTAGVTDGQVLSYEAASGLWKPASIGTYGNIDGGTPSSVYGGIPPIDGGGVI